MLSDSTNELSRRIEQRKRELKEFGKVMTPLGANCQPMTSLGWLNLPLTEVMPEGIEAFIQDRLDFVEASTVNRQIQLLSAVYNRQLTKQRIHLEHLPLDGVKRPKFFQREGQQVFKRANTHTQDSCYFKTRQGPKRCRKGIRRRETLVSHSPM